MIRVVVIFDSPELEREFEQCIRPFLTANLPFVCFVKYQSLVKVQGVDSCLDAPPLLLRLKAHLTAAGVSHRFLYITHRRLTIRHKNFVFGASVREVGGVVGQQYSRQHLLRTVVHELGHACGLGHCHHHPRCAMRFSSTIAQSLQKSPNLCETCYHLLCSTSG